MSKNARILFDDEDCHHLDKCLLGFFQLDTRRVKPIEENPNASGTPYAHRILIFLKISLPPRRQFVLRFRRLTHSSHRRTGSHRRKISSRHSDNQPPITGRSRAKEAAHEVKGHGGCPSWRENVNWTSIKVTFCTEQIFRTTMNEKHKLLNSIVANIATFWKRKVHLEKFLLF